MYLEQHGDPRHRRSALFTVATALAESGRTAEATELSNALRAVAVDAAGAEGAIAMVEAYLALHAGDRHTASRRFAAARQTLVGQLDVRDVIEALVGLVATADDDEEAERARAELVAVCEASAVTLLPRDLALLDRRDRGRAVGAR